MKPGGPTAWTCARDDVAGEIVARAAKADDVAVLRRRDFGEHFARENPGAGASNRFGMPRGVDRPLQCQPSDKHELAAGLVDQAGDR